MRLTLAILLVAGLIATAVPALAQTDLPDTLYTTRNVFMRSGPGMGYRILAEVPGGEQVTVLGESSIWVNVERADDTEGWISGSFLTINPPGSGGGGGAAAQALYALPTQPGDIAMVTAALLNVRKGAGVNFDVKDQLPNGTLLPF